MGKVAFDLGNVLVFFSFPKMLKQMSACTGLSESEIERAFFETNVREKYESGHLSTDQLVHTFQSLAPKPFTKPAFLHAISDIFTPNTPIYPLLHALKKQGHTLFLLSNTSEAHFEFLLPKIPVLQLFEKHILSYKVGAAKPHPSIYQVMLSEAQVAPQNLFYTDDIPEFVAAAKSLNIDAEQYTSVDALEKQLLARKLL